MSDMPATVLVVDDDIFTAELTGLILDSAGYLTMVVEGGMDALEVLSENPGIQVVVSDLHMPLMDGVQLFAELRGRGFRQPFVLLTGCDPDSVREAHPDLDAVLVKDEELQETLPLAVGAVIGSP